MDTAVWPSVFDFDAADADPARLHLQPADFRQQSLRLWRDLAAMQRASIPEEVRQATVTVAIQLHHEDAASDERWHQCLAAPSAPAALGTSRLSAGFDVADRYLTSGLSNCGYEQKEKKQAGGWAADINEKGLFSGLARGRIVSRFLQSPREIARAILRSRDSSAG